MSILTTILAERKYGPGTEIPFNTGPGWDRTQVEPSATPLADLLQASYDREAQAAIIFDVVRDMTGDIFHAFDQMTAVLTDRNALIAILAELPEGVLA